MSKFKVGDKARMLKSKYGEVKGFEMGDIVVISRITTTGYLVGPEGHDPQKQHNEEEGSLYYRSDELAPVKPKPVKPEPKFKVGDRVIANNLVYRGVEFQITEVVEVEESEYGSFYYRGDRYQHGVWEKFLTPVPRPFRKGDLIRAVKGETVIGGRLDGSTWSGLDISGAGWPLSSLQHEKFEITLVEAAPEPVVDPYPLPEEPGLYISQAFIVFRLGEDGNWIEARKPGLIEKVKPETLKSEKHWPLGLIAEPVDK